MKTFSDYWMTANSFIQVNTGEGELLYETAKLLPAKSVIVEIGTRIGGTAYLLGKSNRRTYTIDDYSYVDSNYEQSMANLKSLKNVHLLQGTSESFAKKWKEPIDLLFIDGDHRYEGAKLDIDLWLPFVKQGGYAVFHDYDSHVGITKVLTEVLTRGLLEKVKQEQSMLVCQKP